MDFFWGLERLFYFLRFGSVAGVDRGLERGAVGVKGREEAATMMMTTQLWEECDNEQRSHRPVFGLPREAYYRPTVIQESVLRPCLLGAIEKISLHPGKIGGHGITNCDCPTAASLGPTMAHILSAVEGKETTGYLLKRPRIPTHAASPRLL